MYMGDQLEDLSRKLAKVILDHLRFTESLEYLWDSAKGYLTDRAAGSEDENGMLMYGSIVVFSNNKFYWWFEKYLNEEEKNRFQSHFPESKKFVINVHSEGMRNIELSFFLKIPRIDPQHSLDLFVDIIFPNFEKFEYSISSDFSYEISEEEVSKLLMWHELKS